MSLIQIFNEKILICPECYDSTRKVKLFSDIQDLNIHLKMKHKTKYKISIAGKLKGSADPVSRL